MRGRTTLLVCALAAGCGDEDSTADSGRRARGKRAAASQDAGPRIYDARGELLAGETILGVVVPRGMESAAGANSEKVSLAGRLPLKKVLRFFQKRLTTGQVEVGPNGARFVDATPRPPGDGSKKVNVWIHSDSSGTTSVTLFDHTSRPGPTPSQQDIARALKAPANTERVRGRTE